MRGLLDFDESIVQVQASQPSDWGSPVTPVKLVVVSSPDAINDAHAQIGRHPGADMLRLVRIVNGGDFNCGEWIDGVIEYDSRVADLNNPLLAVHDLVPRMHPQAWHATPTSVMDQAVGKAAALKREHKGAIYAPDERAPQPVKDYLIALENLRVYSAPIYKAVRAIGNRPEFADIAAFSIQRELTATSSNIDNLHLFRDLGVIDIYAGRLDIKAQMLQIGRSFVRQLAHNFMVLETVRPLPDHSQQQIDARTAMWERVMDQFSAERKVIASVF